MSETTSPYEPSQSSEDLGASPRLNDEQAAAHDDKLEPSGFKSNSEILRHREQPDIIVRDRKLRVRDGEAAAELANKYEAFTEALFKLSKYGISVPGIGNYRNNIEDEPYGLDLIYTATQRVEGKNMHKSMREIPPHVIESAMDGMLRYFEDMLTDDSNALYLTDLGLTQLLWGRKPGDTANETYLVDLDIKYTSRGRRTVDYWNSLLKLEHDIKEMERLYHQDYSHYEERLTNIKQQLE